MIKTIKREHKFIAMIVLYTLVVCAVGFFAINQYLEYRYKTELLMKPCESCIDANPEQAGCLNNCFSFEIAIYNDPTTGQWKTLDGKCFSVSGQRERCLGIDFSNITIILNKS